MTKIITRQYHIEWKKLPAAFQGCRILFLSDLHACCYGNRRKKTGDLLWDEYEVLMKRIEQEKPDYILIGGDMLVGYQEPEKQHKTGMERVTRLVCALAEKYPVYYARGNHEVKMYQESWEEYAAKLMEAGVHILQDSSAVLERNGQTIWLHGLDLERKWYPKLRRKQYTFAEMREKMVPPQRETTDDQYHILLAHHPNYLQTYAEWGADLVLAGHFHGGVVRLPWIGGVIGPDFRLFPPYAGGEYHQSDTTMIVSCGLGTHTIKFRLFNPPELTLIELGG